MSLEQLAERIPEFARDIKLNLKNTLNPNPTGDPLTARQKAGIAVSVALALDDLELARELIKALNGDLDPIEIEGIKRAVAIMASNNVYYRSTHLIEHDELSKLPARLRMNVIATPGIEKVNFEIYCTAVSAVAACSMCLQSHVNQLKNHGLKTDAIQDIIRITASVTATHRALRIAALDTH